MIRGLRWSNVGWIGLFSLILLMMATGPGYLKLNYGLLISTWEVAQLGGTSFLKWQGEAAQQLDQETQKRYGADPWAKVAIDCVTTAQPNSATLQEADLKALKLKKPSDRHELIQRFGQPYCRTVSGADHWRITGDRILQAEYNPLKTHIKDSKPNQKKP